MDPNSYFINANYSDFDNILPLTPLDAYFQIEQQQQQHHHHHQLTSNIHPFQISTPTFNEELILSTITPNSIFKDTNYLGFDDNIFDSNESKFSESSHHDEEEEEEEPLLLSPIQSPTLKPKKKMTTKFTPVVCECSNCGTTNTPLWRRNPEGEPLCNACGLFLKLHGKVRPLSLKTDVIKKRNRTSSSSTTRRSKKKKKSHLKRK